MNIPKIQDSDYPGTFQASDAISKKSQTKYVRILATDLSSMVLSALITIHNYSSTESKLWIYIVSGMLMLLGLILSIVVLTKKYEDAWYQGRALAESCKTLTWRFMTCSELFENTLDDQDVKKKFIERINELNSKFSELNKAMSSKLLNKPFITNIMLDVRNLSLDERKEYYVEHRIKDQMQWYSDKAEFNRNKYDLWFLVIIISQALSLISIVFLIKVPESNWNLVGLFTTLASSALSWLQLKQHQELKQAYTTACQELNSIASLSSLINSDAEFSKFVLDSENAVSREHTMWLAQRRI